MLGSSIIWIAFAASLVSAYFFFISKIKKKFLSAAHISFSVSVAGIIFASALLMLYIFQHRFEYDYILNYSSRDLPPALLATVFWAGQEGSFLLWTFFAAIIGLFLIRYTKRAGMESEAMMIYSIVIAFQLLLIGIKTPFRYIWETTPDISVGFIPEDGKGLNLLLQNFWMIIHPPVLFLGFASITVPFVMTIAALWRKNYQDWIKSSLPWTLFGTASLGTGLMLGGYWAYGVLGWGGWWGWDPVENSSLIPWIASVILVHTILIQKFTGRLVKTNYFLAVSAYFLVVYSTFLTRSGVLAKASVHSFMDSGSLTYSLLIVWLALIAISGYGMIILCAYKQSKPNRQNYLLTRESAMSAAMIVIGVCAAIILFGTSVPIFSNSAIEPAFYERATFPFAVLMVILLGIDIRLKWNQPEKLRFVKDFSFPAIVAVVITGSLYFVGLDDWAAAFLIFGSLFSLFMSVREIFRLLKERWGNIGGALAHTGLAILFFGIISSGRYGQKQIVALQINQAQEVFGYKLTYTGMLPTEDAKTKFNINVNKENIFKNLEPNIIESAHSGSFMKNPDYLSFWNGDIYCEPVSLEEGQTEEKNIVDLPKGKAVHVGPMEITFRNYDFSSFDRNAMIMGKSDTISVGVVLEVKIGKNIQKVIPLTKYNSAGIVNKKTAYLKNSKIGFELISVKIAMSKSENSYVNINVVGLNGSKELNRKPETLITEVSFKPFMNFIWIAAILIITGLVTAMLRRVRENRS